MAVFVDVLPPACVAAPVKVNMPRGFCCENSLNSCLRKSPPNVTVWWRCVVVTFSDKASVRLRLNRLRASVSAAIPLENTRPGGPQFVGS